MAFQAEGLKGAIIYLLASEVSGKVSMSLQRVRGHRIHTVPLAKDFCSLMCRYCKQNLRNTV